MGRYPEGVCHWKISRGGSWKLPLNFGLGQGPPAGGCLVGLPLPMPTLGILVSMWVPTPALHSPGFTCSPWELPPCCSRGATAVILSANKQHVKLYKPLGLATGSTVRIDRASKRQTDRHKPGEHSYGSSEDSYLFVKVNCIFEARHFCCH